MTKRFSKSLATISGLLIYAFLAAGTSMCEEGEQLSSDPEDNIEFVGRVEGIDGNPKNNRLVLLYLNGKEIGRGKTALGKYEAIDKVPNDGLFTIDVPNIYELSEKELQADGHSLGSTGLITSVTQLKLGGRTYINVETISEGKDKLVDISSRKNVAYTVKVLPEDYESLPEDIKDESNSTVLSKDGNVVVVSDQGVPKTQIEDVVFSGNIEEVKLKEIDFPLNNCDGSSEIRQKYNKSESYLHEKSLDFGGEVKGRYLKALLVGIDLTSHFESRYGFTEREFSSEIIEYEFVAKPNTNINYKILWYELWEHGEAQVQSSEGIVTVPFKVKTGLKYEVQTEKNTCR